MIRALHVIVPVALTLGAAAHAQMELAVMQGTVVDDTGRPLDGATILLRDLERGREVSIKTDKSGRFYRRGLPGGEYEMVVDKAGHSPIKDKVQLIAGTDRRFDFKLAKAAPEGAGEFSQGVAAFSKGDHAAAAKAFELALEKAPNLPEVRINLALSYLRLDRPADAVAQLEKAAADLGPDNARVQFQLGGAYLEMKELDKAMAAFEQGLITQTDLADPIAYEAAVTLGAIYFAKGDNDKAAAQFGKTLAVKPSATATLGLAKVYFSKGEVDRALKLFDQVVSTYPGTPEAAQAEAFIKELRKGGV